MTSLEQCKQQKQLSYLQKKNRENINIYEPHQQTIATEQKAPNLGQVHTNAEDENVLKCANPHP